MLCEVLSPDPSLRSFTPGITEITDEEASTIAAEKPKKAKVNFDISPLPSPLALRICRTTLIGETGSARRDKDPGRG